MIKNINVVFMNAISKSKIYGHKRLSAAEANLVIPSDGFVRIHSIDYKVVQIVKDIMHNDLDGTLDLTVHVFLKKVSNNDYYLI